MNELRLLPDAASTVAGKTDELYFALLAVSAVIVLLVASLLAVFASRYRRGSKAPRGDLPGWVQRDFEIGWTAATLFFFLFLFWWAGSNQIAALVPPENAMEIHVVAKQWMWKTQHPNGLREINALHVPVDEPIRLAMTSQDVIHSFFVPAFRIKQDVLPGRYTEAWFQATKTGSFHLLCTAFCGTSHSSMTGEIFVMTKPDFAAWLARQPGAEDLVAKGETLFTGLGCAACHTPGSPVRSPNLAGVFGRETKLGDGREVVVDERFVRDAILDPNANALAGYQAVMPSYRGRADDEDVLALTAYIRSLSPDEGGHS
jgi:cytochrome c oxidase subunit 2